MLMGTGDIAMPTPPTPASCAFYQEPRGEGGSQCATDMNSIFFMPGRLIAKATGFSTSGLDTTAAFAVTLGTNIAAWLLVLVVASKLGGRR